MRIILAWELGGNYGHLAILLGIARHLRRRRHRVLFVIKNHPGSRELLDDEGFGYISAPSSAVRKKLLVRPVSFADILSGAGFGSYEVLDGLTQFWLEVFKGMEPDVVVCQYAPVAQFVARLSHVPCLSVSTGFECPPDVAPFPCFRTYRTTTRTQLLAKEVALLDNVNRILSLHGHPSCSRLQDVLKSDLDLLATIPEMDHYRQRRRGRYIGPLSMLDHGMELGWRQGKLPRIFVYLRPFPEMRGVLDILAGSGGDVIAHIPAIDETISVKYSHTSVRIVTSMVKLSGLLADMELAITHAGHGTACAMLRAGVPLMMFPTTIEQRLTSRNIEDLGCGIFLARKDGPEVFRAGLTKLLVDGSEYRARAQKVASKYATYNTERQIVRIVNTVERLPAWLSRRGRRVCSA